MMGTPVAKWGSNLSHNFLNSKMMEKSGDRPGKIVRWAIEHVGMDPMHAQVFASTAKVKCSDYGVENANLGIDLMGEAGLRHDRGMEKLLRDAKLLQIYEGTNEVLSLGTFKRNAALDDPEVKVLQRV
jgi:alkylation response protein AidB-like acyl-CoA dehydrogenase